MGAKWERQDDDGGDDGDDDDDDDDDDTDAGTHQKSKEAEFSTRIKNISSSVEGFPSSFNVLEAIARSQNILKQNEKHFI